ncbi:MAG: hypothetical protein QOJ06_922 [Pseudonocardiales bacterium]|nr:hypothetical protein [Pseudonocardiales bacterium]
MHSTAATRTQELVLGLSQTRRRDTLALRQELIALLRRAVPFDAWCWAFADPARPHWWTLHHRGSRIPAPASCAHGQSPPDGADLRQLTDHY